MAVEHDDDDEPEEVTWLGLYYGIFNRWAEECARWARAMGLL